MCDKNVTIGRMLGTNGIGVTEDSVLIRIDTSEKKSDSGLVLPTVSTGDDEIITGVVVAVGPGYNRPDRKTISTIIEVGQEVAFVRSLGTLFKISGVEHAVVSEGRILLYAEELPPIS